MCDPSRPSCLSHVGLSSCICFMKHNDWSANDYSSDVITNDYGSESKIWPFRFWIRKVRVSLKQCFTTDEKFTDPTHDFRLPPHCKCDLCSSGMLRNVDWKLFTDDSRQNIGPILRVKGQGSVPWWRAQIWLLKRWLTLRALVAYTGRPLPLPLLAIWKPAAAASQRKLFWRMRSANMYHTWGTRNICFTFWSGNLSDSDRPTHILKNNIKADLLERECQVADWIQFTQESKWRWYR